MAGRTGHVTHEVSEKRSDGRARLKREGTCAETRFGLSEKRTSPFKSAGESVQSTAGGREVRISGQSMFRGTVQEQWLPSPIAYFPFTSPLTRHRVPSRFKRPIRP